MPFQSEKQRRYMWKNHPGIARKWSKKYGSKSGKRNYSHEAIAMAKKIYG